MTNQQIVAQYLNDWMHLPRGSDPLAVARVLCHRLGVDPDETPAPKGPE